MVYWYSWIVVVIFLFLYTFWMYRCANCYGFQCIAWRIRRPVKDGWVGKIASSGSGKGYCFLGGLYGSMRQMEFWISALNLAIVE